MSQVLVNSCVSAGIFAVLAVSFAVIFNTARFFHFAHGGIFTAGAYTTYWCSTILKWPFWSSILVAIILCASLGSIIDLTIYRALRRRRAKSLVLLLASLGIMIVLQNVVSLLFGDQTRSYGVGSVQPGWLLFGARITGIQVVILVISACCVIGTWGVFSGTKWGLVLRAIGGDRELSIIRGIAVDQYTALAFAIGSAMACLGAVLVALNSEMSPTLGFDALLVAVVAVVIGGVGRIETAVFGGVLIGFVENLVAWKLSTEWRTAFVFAVLIIVLMVCPAGIGGKWAAAANK